MKYLFCLFIFLISFNSYTQEKLSYQIFDKNGKKSDYGKMLKVVSQAEVILFGEYHDNPIIHWLQLGLTKDLQQKHQLVLGAEMIEADNQEALDRYLSDEINQKGLDTLARLWNNHKTDYKPLVDFAKAKKIKFIATNIPRRYASMVYKNDFESLDKLTPEEKNWIAPLPIAYDPELPGYKNMLTMMGDHPNEKLPKAQAIKDATMGHFIFQNLDSKSIFLHFNGTYHSDYFEGIYWYLKRQNENLKIKTIAAVSQRNLTKLEKEHFNKADFIIVVDEDMTKTF